MPRSLVKPICSTDSDIPILIRYAFSALGMDETFTQFGIRAPSPKKCLIDIFNPENRPPSN
jgi:hypothetical protein